MKDIEITSANQFVEIFVAKVTEMAACENWQYRQSVWLSTFNPMCGCIIGFIASQAENGSVKVNNEFQSMLHDPEADMVPRYVFKIESRPLERRIEDIFYAGTSEDLIFRFGKFLLLTSFSEKERNEILSKVSKALLKS